MTIIKNRCVFNNILLALSCLPFVSIAIAQQCPVIPLPNSYQKEPGQFTVSVHTSIVNRQPEFETAARYLQRQLLQFTGIGVSRSIQQVQQAIVFKKRDTKGSNSEAYALNMSPREIRIEAATQQGIFNGVVSLLQLVKNNANKGVVALDCWKIEDRPKFAWRGLLIDEARHFFGKKKIKQVLDWMAFYKLNRLHWHLTDNQGWRIDIGKYPLLSKVGGIGNNTDPYAPAKYYTQEDIKEIVDYAAERCIEVVPEIDMPGHARAANKAYPAFSGGGSAKVPDFTFNPGKEETYGYLTDILREVNVLFPSDLMFLGADEVALANDDWNKNKLIQDLIRQKNLGDIHGAEKYFLRRMADSVYAMNKKVLVWDDATNNGLPADKTIVFWWRHERPEVLQQAFDKGYSIVLCPRLPYYLDFVQQDSDRLGRKWAGNKFNMLEDVYGFSLQAIPVSINKKQLLGIQGNLWGETIKNEQRLDYMLFPRITALAESAWTEDSHLDFDLFKGRLNKHLTYFNASGLYYFREGRSEN
ncbi:MAG: beta-N-acetylhexosaminidase [Niabella sp.]